MQHGTNIISPIGRLFYDGAKSGVKIYIITEYFTKI